MEISYTMLNLFTNCEYSWYLRYIKKISTVDSSASAYGSAVHSAIKIGYENNLDRDEWVKVFKQEWFIVTSSRDIIFSHSGDFLNRLKEGQKLVGTYYDKFVQGFPTPKAVELRFGKKEAIKIGDHILVGVIDQIDADEHLIDLKTGAKPTKLELDLDLQFTIYSLAYRLLFGKDEKALVLRHLNSMRDFVTSRSLPDFELLKEEINKITQRIQSNIFVRNWGRKCANCDFLEHCLGKERQIERWSFKRK